MSIIHAKTKISTTSGNRNQTQERGTIAHAPTISAFARR